MDGECPEVRGCLEAVGFASGRPLGIGTVEGACGLVKGQRMVVRGPGERVYLVDPRDGSVVSTPPEGLEVRPLLESLLAFARDGSVDPLLRAVVFHPLFESIHPFMDGNGRTGRALMVAMIGSPVVPLSEYLEGNRRDYYRHIRRVGRDGDRRAWKPWMMFALEGMRASAEVK